jgi:hypothetical protein
MPDDLDDQLRAAMKTLDDETPSGYFEALPNQILARLEDGSMQNTGTTDIRDKRDALMGPPVAAVDTSSSKTSERDEDSGLHDIRNLAQSTKQRLSSRRGTQPPMSDDDVLASSSGSWKNIALPQPARMVALPEIADLPSKAEVVAAEKKARKAKKTDAPDDVLAPIASANAAVAAMSAAPVAATETSAIPQRQAFSLPSQQGKRSKGPLLAVVGLGVAAAAGGLFFMQQSNSSDSPSPAASQMSDRAVAVRAEKAPAAAPTVEPIAPEVAAVEPATPEPVEEAVAATATGAAADDPADARGVSRKPGKATATKKGGDRDKEDAVPKVEKAAEPKVEKADVKKAKGDDSEPSFDALLKEAGVEDKKEAKPKLDKKSLSGEDFKKGMAAVSGKAQGCYKGTQGTAMVKLTVAPSGQVTKASVAGAFAGTPEAACVEAAVKGASFPAWDGGPQSFTYSYMLAD